MRFPKLPKLTVNEVASVLINRDPMMWVDFFSCPCPVGGKTGLKDRQWNELSAGTIIKTDEYRMLFSAVSVFVRDSSGSDFFACFASETSKTPLFLVKKYENKSSDKVQSKSASSGNTRR